MKFGQVILCYKRKKFIKEFSKNCDLKINSRPFCVCKELSITSTGKLTFFKQGILYQICISKTIKICPNQHTGLLRFLFTENIGSGTNLKATFFIEFFDKKFSFVILHKLAKFHYQTVFTLKLSSKIYFMFCAQPFNDAMAFEYLKS